MTIFTFLKTYRISYINLSYFLIQPNKFDYKITMFHRIHDRQERVYRLQSNQVVLILYADYFGVQLSSGVQFSDGVDLIQRLDTRSQVAGRRSQ